MKNKITLGIIILVILGGGLYALLAKGPSAEMPGNSTTNTSSTTNVPASSHSSQSTSGTVLPKPVTTSYGTCGFRVTSPAANARVTFPLIVSGTIDNTKADALGCLWEKTASRAGTAQLYFYSKSAGWQPSGVPVAVTNNGLVASVASSSKFSVTLNAWTTTVGIYSGTPIKITFTEVEQPNGAKPRAFDFYLTLN